MPKCVDCKHEGEYAKLKVPYPIDLMMGMKFGMPGQVKVSMVGFVAEAQKHGFTEDDLTRKAMICKAPGGGPTQDPIVLVQAIADQPCAYFAPKKQP